MRGKRTEAAQAEQLEEKTVRIQRVSKAVKGGRIVSFSALVVIGDRDGRVGIGRGKAREVPAAISMAGQVARRSMIEVSLNGDTLWHGFEARHGATKVMVKPAPEGTGVIAGSSLRPILELLGVRDAVAKCYGATNPTNVALAAIKGLRSMESPTQVLQRRGLPLSYFES